MDNSVEIIRNVLKLSETNPNLINITNRFFEKCLHVQTSIINSLMSFEEEIDDLEVQKLAKYNEGLTDAVKFFTESMEEELKEGEI